MCTDLPERLLEHVQRADLFPRPGRALLAVSGGPDSVAMMGLFMHVAPRLGLRLEVAHVDHGILPDSSEVARAVEEMARLLELPVRVDTLGLGAGTSETRARVARYASLQRTATETGSRYIVTAHHADDQVETVFLRFLRGSGMAGLAGMPDRNDDGLVRPLLPWTREALTEWARADDVMRPLLPLVHRDPSNHDQRHDRAWMRHAVLPVVRHWGAERVDQALLKITENARNDRAAWSVVLRTLPSLSFEQVPGGVQVARPTLQGYDPRLSVALLCAAAREAGARLGPERASRIWSQVLAAPSGRRFELGDGWLLETSFDRLIIYLPSPAPDQAAGAQWGETDSGRVAYGDWMFSWRPERAEKLTRSGLVTWVTPGEGSIRTPRAGDRVTPLGGPGRRKVSRLLMEGRIPRARRLHYPVLARGDQIVWLPGVCRTEAEVPGAGETALRLDAGYTGSR